MELMLISLDLVILAFLCLLYADLKKIEKRINTTTATATVSDTSKPQAWSRSSRSDEDEWAIEQNQGRIADRRTKDGRA